MVLQLCPRPLGEAWRDEVVTLELKGNVEQLKSLFSLRDRVQDLLSSLSDEERLTGMETIALSCEFYLMFTRDPNEKVKTTAFKVGPKEMIPRQGQKNTTQYPVKLKLVAKPEMKKRVIDNFTALLVFLRDKYRGTDVKVNFYLMLVETFLYVLAKKDEIGDYFGGKSTPEASELLKPKAQDCKQVEEDRRCSVCGCAAIWKCSGVICCSKCRKFFFKTSAKEQESWTCQNQAGYCSILHKLQYIEERLFFPSTDGSLQPYISQSSALCPKCRYKRCIQLGMIPPVKKELSPNLESSSRMDLASPDSLSSPEPSSFKVGSPSTSILKASSPSSSILSSLKIEPSSLSTSEIKDSVLSLTSSVISSSSSSSVSKCVICLGVDGIASFHGRNLCQYCRMFLNDSIDENTYSTLSCENNSKTCVIDSRGTQNYSTCPGCWIEKMKGLGVLESAILANNVEDISQVEDEKNKHSEEKVKLNHLEDEVQTTICSICLKETIESFCGLLCCQNCKKFFLKSLKSRCYKDYCCSRAEGGWMGVGGIIGEGNQQESSGCSLKTKSPCQQCRWKKCVSTGLKDKYFSESKSGVKRTATSETVKVKASEGESESGGMDQQESSKKVKLSVEEAE